MDLFTDNVEKYQLLFNFLKEHNWDKCIEYINSIDSSFDINVRDVQQNYFLTYAIIFNKYDIVSLLLEKGAKIDISDQEDHSILYIPIKFGYDDILELLLKENSQNIGVSIVDIKDKNMKIPLHYAILLKNINAVKLLMKYGSNPNMIDKNGYNALHFATYSRSLEICKHVVKTIGNINARCITGETPLHIACNLQLTDIVRLLIEYNANVDLQDYSNEVSPLHYSVHLNNTELVGLLLKHGAHPNIQDVVGNTALHYAILDNAFEIFMMLTNSDATKNIINMNLWNIDGEIPLHVALKNDQANLSDYLDVLIDKSNLSTQDVFGNTCLHYIVKMNLWQEYASVLVKKRLDIFILNSSGVRPIDLVPVADRAKFLDIVIASYYERLKKSNNMWQTEWENICSKDFGDTEKDLSALGKGVTLATFEQTCKNKIKEKLNNVMESIKSSKSVVCKSYPIKKSKSCLDISDGSSVNFCTFTGSTLDILAGLLYLLKKHKNACSTLTKNFAENKDLCKFYKSIGIIMNSQCEFLNFEIVWVHQKLYLIEGFYDQFKKCMGAKRFVIIPVGIEMREGSHANYIIYDNVTKEVERFEPHGATTPPGLHYNPNLLDEILESRFKIIDKTIKYIRPREFLPKIGFQLMDIHEHNKKKIGDPSGFCALWAIWYVDMRLTYRDTDRNELVKSLIKNIRAQNISFKNLIRNYGKNVADLRDTFLHKSEMDINDWLNDQYTDVQINSIMTQLVNEIENII